MNLNLLITTLLPFGSPLRSGCIALNKSTLICLIFISTWSMAQPVDSTVVFNKKRFTLVSTVSGTAYTAGMASLASIWYQEQLSDHFTFFNDNAEWMLMDKVGHFYTSFHVGNACIHMLKWTGSSKKKSILYGGFAGTALMLPIEVLDGFSKEYGASWGDLIANTSGSIVVTTQHLLWDEVRITPKFSYHQTRYAAIRPNTLGSSPLEQFIKDYNGQTYWLSFNIASLARLQKFPQWLNLSLGYSANEMVYAMPSENRANGYSAYGQGFLSLDVDFNRIKTKHAFLRSLFRGLNLLHVPFPAIEYNGRNGFQFHPLYF